MRRFLSDDRGLRAEIDAKTINKPKTVSVAFTGEIEHFNLVERVWTPQWIVMSGPAAHVDHIGNHVCRLKQIAEAKFGYTKIRR